MDRRHKRPRHTDQMDLLSWAPADPTASYPAERLKASSFARAVSKSVSETLRRSHERGRPRAAVAVAMTDYLDGQSISEDMLNGYAAESRDDLIISLVRLDALLAVTKDNTILETIARRHGWMVVERRYLDAIKLADLLEHGEEVKREVDYYRRRFRSGGTL